jgi:hypothetical protein
VTGLARIGTCLLSLGALALGGCSITKLAIGTQAEIMATASPVIEEQTDYEFAASAIPSALIQAEGLLKITPEDPHLLLLAARGFASYGYGFAEDEMARAEQKGDLDRADYHRARARALYLKGRDFGIRLLELEAADLKSHFKGNPDDLKRFLTEKFSDKEDAPALFWTGYAWGSAISVSLDDPMLISDLPFASAIVERAVALDEGFYNAAGHTFLGVSNSSRGKAIGGDPPKGKQHFERALALTQRKALLTQVNYAQYYAVQEQDRKLFDALVSEVLDAPAPTPSPLALPNTIAKRRAERLKAQADSLIPPPIPDTPPEPPKAAPPPTPAAAPAAVPPAVEPAKPAKPTKASTPATPKPSAPAASSAPAAPKPATPKPSAPAASSAPAAPKPAAPKAKP